MPTIIESGNAAEITTLLSSEFIDHVHQYLGLDPAIADNLQPVSVLGMIRQAVAVLEENQRRIILTKRVQIFPNERNLCPQDNRIYLPYGIPHATPEIFLQEDPDVAETQVSGVIYRGYEPAFLWKSDWHTISFEKNPQPLRSTYEAGYQSHSEIPEYTLAAIKIYCHWLFNREDNQEEIPNAFWHHCYLGKYDFHRFEELYR